LSGRDDRRWHSEGDYSIGEDEWNHISGNEGLEQAFDQQRPSPPSPELSPPTYSPGASPIAPPSAEAKETEHPLGFPETKRTAPPPAREATPPSSPASDTSGIEQPGGAADKQEPSENPNLDQLNKLATARALLPSFRHFWEFDIIPREILLDELIQRIVVLNQPPKEAEYAVRRIYTRALDLERNRRDREAQRQKDSERHQQFLEFGLRQIRENREKQRIIKSVHQGLHEIQKHLDDSDQEQAPTITDTAGQQQAPAEQESPSQTRKTSSASTSSSSSSGGSSDSSTPLLAVLQVQDLHPVVVVAAVPAAAHHQRIKLDPINQQRLGHQPRR